MHAMREFRSGDPSLEVTEQLVYAMEEAGAVQNRVCTEGRRICEEHEGCNSRSVRVNWE